VPTSTSPLPLSEDERAQVQLVVSRGHPAARIQTRARVLLKLADGWSATEIHQALDVSLPTVWRVRKHFAAGGVQAVLTDKRQQRRRAALSGEQQAHLIAIACSDAPDGHDHWTLRLLAGKAVELGFVASISPETIRALLKKPAQAVAAQRVVHSDRERGLCGGHGGRARPVCPGLRRPVRTRAPAGLFG